VRLNRGPHHVGWRSCAQRTRDDPHAERDDTHPRRDVPCAVWLRASFVRHRRCAPPTTWRHRRSGGRDHAELSAGVVGKSLAQVIGQPRDATFGCHDVPRERRRHVAQRGSRRCCASLPVAELAVRIAKPMLQLRGAARQRFRSRHHGASPSLDTPRHRQRERRRHQHENRERTRRIDGILRGRGRASAVCARVYKRHRQDRARSSKRCKSCVRLSSE
jgi:hypothetical protein